MKVAVCLLVLLPLAFCASLEDRFILDSFEKLSLSEVVHELEVQLGSDTTEAMCEAACPSLISSIPGGSLVAGYLCEPACEKLQDIIQAQLE